jgi:phosphoglucosamine mutase
MTRLFGTDGVRGVANQEITAELAYQLGKAATYYFGQTVERPKIVIGRDTRVSGMMLEAALAAGVCSAGGEALMLGVAPTPGIAFLTKELGAQAGVVLSASHNPFQDNGIKFFSSTGYKLPDQVEDELERIIKEGVENLPRPIGDKIGEIILIENELSLYEEYLKKTISTTLEGIKVVLDCSNGASFKIAPVLYRTLGAEVIALSNEPTGININDHCGSTHLEKLQKAVVEHKAHIGIAHDGDADRCLAITEEGRVVDGDRIMLLCALLLKEQGLLTDNKVVATVMSNLGFHQAARNYDLNLEIASVGDRYVLEMMKEKNACLGGEQSGHIIFGNLSTTGDGILTGLQLLAALKESGKKMSELSELMVDFPQILVNVRVTDRKAWETNDRIQEAIGIAEKKLGENGRILVRPSGTEPLLRIMAEGPSQDELEELIHHIAEITRQEIGEN